MVKGLILIAPAIDMTQNLMWQQFSIKEKKELIKKVILRGILKNTIQVIGLQKISSKMAKSI